MRGGGCWTAAKTPESVRRIKYFDSSLSWLSATFNYVPLHVITAYIQPQDGKKAKRTIANLEHVLSLILDRLP